MARGASDVRFEVDHIVPLGAGGTNDSANLRTLYIPCHRLRIGHARQGEPSEGA